MSHQRKNAMLDNIKWISNETHVSNVEKPKSPLDTLRRMCKLADQANRDTNSALSNPRDTDSVPSSFRDTDSAPSSPQDHKGKRQLTLQEVAEEEEWLKSRPISKDDKPVEKLVIPDGPLPGGMRRGDAGAGTSGDRRIGQQLGNYQLERHLGAGAFGAVYLGKDILLDIPVAIKVLHEIDQSRLHAFIEEARIIAKLQHSHIVNVRYFGVDDGTPYLAMDFARHGTLEYRDGTRLPPEQVATYVMHIAKALEHAHSKNVIHRDIKPTNLLLEKKPNGKKKVLVGDFGLAKILQNTTFQNRQGRYTAGTPAYMAPEQWDGNPCKESDQYALGVVVYQWLSGHLPFEGPDIEAQHKRALPKPIARISQEIQNVVFCALKKDPTRRFKSVMEFAQAFKRACDAPASGQQAEASTSRAVRDQLAEIRRQDTIDKHYKAGEEHLKARRYKEARDDFIRVIALDGNHARAFARRGRAYLELRQFKEALDDFNQALDLQKNNLYALGHRGITYREMKQYEKARADFNQVLALGYSEPWIEDELNKLRQLIKGNRR
jgi:serine/threonine protein kinase